MENVSHINYHNKKACGTWESCRKNHRRLKTFPSQEIGPHILYLSQVLLIGCTGAKSVQGASQVRGCYLAPAQQRPA